MGRVFISHASSDDGFVTALRTEIEGQGLAVWVDSRNLRGGDKLAPEIEKAIEEAESFLEVLRPHNVNSPWVRREIQGALRVAKERPGPTGSARPCSPANAGSWTTRAGSRSWGPGSFASGTGSSRSESLGR